MTWFDRYIVAAVAPGLARKRIANYRAVKAFYEAGEASRYRKKRTDRASANTNNSRSAEAIRITARHLDENYDIASGILDVLVANTVGAGIQPEPQILLKSGEPATELNSSLLKLYEDWRFRPEVTFRHDYYELQRLVARSYFRDGEGFGNRLIGPMSGLDHGTIVPYSIEALEADFVPYDLNSDSPTIRQGVEINTWGRSVAFHVLKHHPGDTFGTLRGIGSGRDMKRVSAETMMHVALRKRLHQIRGMSLFATIANRLDDVKDIDECERVAAKVAASMAAYIKKGSPESYEADAAGATTETGRRQMQFEAGLIFDDLEAGEEVGTIDTKRPNNALIPFRDSNLRAVASGSMASFSSIAKKYDGTYSAQRQELVEHYQTYQIAAGPLIYGWCQPSWEGFVDASVGAGLVTLPPQIDRTTLWDCTHTGPAMPWIDPKKEIESHVVAMQWKLTSHSRVIRSRGANPEQVYREIQRDEARAKELGIDISGPPPTAAAHRAMEELSGQEQ